MGRPRIGIDGRYIQDHFPGIGRYTYNLARSLADIEDDADYVVFVNDRLCNSRYDLSQLERRNVALRQVAAAPFTVGEQIVIPREAKRAGVNLFHSPYYIKPYRLPCPSVVTVHDVNSARFPESLPSRRARAVFRVTTILAARTSRKVIVASHATERDLVSLFHVPREKIAVTHYAADEGYRPGLDAATEAQAVLRRYQLPGRYILYLGINKPLKNLGRLIEAYAVVLAALRENPANNCLPHLVLAGTEDPRYPEARQLVSRLGLAEWVHFTGTIAETDQPYLYALAELFVFPSLMEGFGLPPLEAMACGTPVACSTASSLPEVVGDAALTFDPLNVAEMAEAILKVTTDRGLRQELRERSLARARQFSWQRTAAETAAVYREVLQR